MRVEIIALVILVSSLTHSSFAAFDSANFIEHKQLKITRVTPSGEDVSALRQVVFQFNRPVVPIGKMERSDSEIPVNIEPKLNCKWRWLNTSSLACQLDDKHKLKEATKYTITMNQGVHAEDGSTIVETYTHNFITQRPKIRTARFSNWESPGTPVIRLTFNQPVSKSSVEKHIVFTHHKVGAKKEYSSYEIKVEKDPDDIKKTSYMVVSNKGYVLDFEKNNLKNGNKVKNDDKQKKIAREEAKIVWLVSPPKKLPLDASIDLKITPGLVSAFGREKGIEKRTVVNFHTFPKFAFLGVRCIKNNGKKILITKANNHEIGKCDPLKTIALSFSTPVVNSQIKNNVIIQPQLAVDKKDYEPWANHKDHYKLRREHKKNEHYNVWLPERLKPAKTYNLKTKKALTIIDKVKFWFSDIRPSELKDIFDRTLEKPIDLTFFTDHYTPNFELKYNTAVLEEQINSDVPLYVTNLDSVTFNYKKLTSYGTKKDQSLNINVSKEQDIQFAAPMNVRKMLRDKSGVVYGTIDSKPHVTKYPRGNVLFASVSPYQVHVKIGHYNTLIWVTDLATGEPVKNADVSIYKNKLSSLSANFKTLDKGKTDTSGMVLLKGTLELDPKLDLASWCRLDNQDDCDRLFVRVDKADKMSIMPLEQRFKINTYHASNNMVMAKTKKKYGHIHAWGTTAQGVYRVGGKIQFKLYVRDQNNDTYALPPRKTYKLEIIDPTRKIVHEIKNITLSEFGSYDGEYNVPENASVGWYSFNLKGDFTDDYTWQPMQVLVSDFTPASFKVINSINDDIFHPKEEVEISSSAKLHSGGAYTDADSRITATLKKAYFSSKHPIANKFIFDSYQQKQTKKIFQKMDNIGNKGEIKHNFTLPKEDIVFGRLTIETAIQDERGKYITTASHADYFAADRLVGLKHTKWLYEKNKPAKIKYIVVDERGIPTANTDVSLKVERLRTKAVKAKGVGKSYLTNYIDEWITVKSCEGTSKIEPLICSFTPKELGTYKIIANIKDTKGNTHSTEIEALVAGKGYVRWHSPDDNSLQIIPEKTAYNIGDKARYLVKNPYPRAKALISIERYGVLKSWVEELKGSTAIIEFDIEKNFMPGFYLSAIIVSPRGETISPAIGEIDLGKPSFKIGYIKVPVKDPYKQIDVSVKTNAKVYKPKDTVTATIHVKAKHKDKNDKFEIAVAVVDEAVFDLVQKGKNYFDPYDGFYKLDGLDLQNYNLLKHLIGKQSFNKKEVSPDAILYNRKRSLSYENDALFSDSDKATGISIRSLFKYVAYWEPSIKPDKNGNATINFEVPDNLTGWRILALAVTTNDRMGLGDVNFKVNRLTEIYPVMPNQVTEGDKFQAGFSVMNRADKPRDIKVIIDVSGDVKPTKPFSKIVHLKPYKRQVIYMPISSVNLQKSRDVKAGSITFTATAKDSIDVDSVKHQVPIYKRRLLETAASYGTTTKNSVSESLHFPSKIHSDEGDVSIVLSPSVIGNVGGAFRYVRDYPYTCWEQKLSKGVMASHYQNLKDYLPDELNWNTSKTLPNDILKQAANYQAPNGGMVYFMPQNKYVSPYLSAYTALAFNWLRESGHEVQKEVEAKLHSYLENLLKSDITPSFYSQEMSYTVRAVTLAALAEHGKVSLKDLERYRLHVQTMSLFGKAHYLQAALDVDGAETIAKEVMDIILSYSYQSGGKFSFNEELDDSYARILSSNLRSNCKILSAVTKYDKDKTGASVVGDVPFKLARSITKARGKLNHWENTQENIFCMNSLIDYSRTYENVKPNMHISVNMDKENLGKVVFKDLRDDAVILSRPINKGDPNTKRNIKLSKSGDGRLYYATRMSYALLGDHLKRLNAGIDIRKEYSVERNNKWVLLNNLSEIKRGELLRIDIYVSLASSRNFVVVEDPVPGGLEPVNLELATVSTVDADKKTFQAARGSWWFQFDNWHNFNISRWGFYHKELRHNAVRFYSDHLPLGNYHLSYKAQAIVEGDFAKMPVHAKEMYEPDVFGKGLSGRLKVGEK